MQIIVAVFTVLLSACAGALASFIQIRALKRDEIFLEKIERAYLSAQDFSNILDIVFLNMEFVLHQKLSLKDYYELAKKSPENKRAYRDLELCLNLYFPNLVPAFNAMYESRGRLIKMFHLGEKFLSAGQEVGQQIKTDFAKEVKIFDRLSQSLRSEIAAEARKRFTASKRFF